MTLPKILLICHDAGGANILFSLVKKCKLDFEWKLVLFGPAKVIFKPLESFKNIEAKTPQKIKQALNFFNPDLVLTGTSEKSNLERNFIKIAKKNNFKTASFL